MLNREDLIFRVYIIQRLNYRQLFQIESGSNILVIISLRNCAIIVMIVITDGLSTGKRLEV